MTNLSSIAEACIEVQESGYRSLIILGDGLAIPDVASITLDRSLKSTHDMWSLEFIGMDPLGGNLLDLSAHDPSYVSDVDDHGDLPGAAKPLISKLLPNVPNPFNPTTQIRFDLSAGTEVSLKIYDVRGKLVRTLAARTFFTQGRHAVVWDGRNDQGRGTSSGVYYVRLESQGMHDSQQILLLK